MFRSLRGRLVVLLVLLIAAAIAAGLLMVGLFRQSATAQIGQADAEIGRACDAIAASYRVLSAGSRLSESAGDEISRGRLEAVVWEALRNRPGVEGGIWQTGTGSLAYAFPTYEGAGPKTDVPQAELPRIIDINRAALAEGRQASRRYDAASQTLLLTACPLPGPASELTGWTMTRVSTFAGRAYQQLMAGLGVLLAAVLAAAALLARLAFTWSRHVARIETALNAHDIAELPRLPATGERELDRIVSALNDAGRRLADARKRADRLAREVAAGERLAAIGRVAAGVAHEIRNPIAAMQLKAENALAAGVERKNEALSVILGQIRRLDELVSRLLTVSERDRPRLKQVPLPAFLEACTVGHADLAFAKGVTLESTAELGEARFDPDQIRRALDNLVINAIHAAPANSCIGIRARREAEKLILSVRDQGSGPPVGIRDHLFELFVTGRADGTGLGLSIVREVAEAHGGSVRFTTCEAGTTFEINVPWQSS
ncbi:MAG: HAMP domain-containing histidine kinase [Alphaproteobacteria bacterium]|nr:HAMP domain-containing histidine kinase [Alphaproteobacteria bacterium]